MSDNTTEYQYPDAECTFARDMGPQHIGFTDPEGNEVGKLFLENPMRFEGDVDASAKVFFDFVIAPNLPVIPVEALRRVYSMAVDSPEYLEGKDDGRAVHEVHDWLKTLL